MANFREMGQHATAAFWSYAHQDQEDDAGILTLAGRLQAEFSLITGQELDLFVDRSSISWGDEWRARIERALVETTFFIPIVSPRYFTRPECRRELLSFYSQAESLGLSVLILPILYVATPGLASDSPDEAVAICGRLQYADWTELRLQAIDSPEYRKSVNALARRLADTATEVANKQVAQESRAAESDNHESQGFLETVARINALLPDWFDAVQGAQVVDAQHEATWGTYRRRLAQQEAAKAPQSARFAILQRLALDELPLAERQLSLAKTYVARTVELDPLVVAAARTARAHLELVPSLNDLCVRVGEAMDEVDQLAQSTTDPNWLRGSAFAARYSHISRAMAKLAEIYRQSEKYIDEGNTLVSRWASDLRELRAEV